MKQAENVKHSRELRRFKPYPAYKDSGVEWLGKIPPHWNIKRIKNVARLHTGGTPAGLLDEAFEEEGVPWVKPDDLDGDHGISTAERNLSSSTARAIGVVRAGSILVCGIGTVGKTGHAPFPVCTNQQINAISFLPEVNDRYGHFVASCLEHEFARRANKVTIAICNKSEMGEPFLPIPPLREQHAISTFLDRETARIDLLLAKRERLIMLLEENRTAVITHAVTRGLDPNVPMKGSGVEWLGKIPAHWEVKPIRALAKPGYKTFTDGDWIESPFIRDEGIRLIQTGNIGVGEYTEQGFRYIDEETFRAFQCTEVLPGDVLICRLADPVGRACLAPDLGCRMITSVDVCILKPASDVHAAFVVYALSGSEYLAWLGGICRGGTRDRVSRSMLGAIRVQKPPLPEQLAIAAFLDSETSKIDCLIDKVRDAVERLKELRTTIISAAVTGKIDVREEIA